MRRIRPPVNRRDQFWFWLAVSIVAWILFLFWPWFGAAQATVLPWQQADGQRPIVQWWVKRFQSPTPIAVIYRTALPEQTVTPGHYPTPGPGTPPPTLRQYQIDLPLLGGWIVSLVAEDDLGQRSADSNLKQIPSETPTPLPTRTPTQTRTESPTRSPTFARPLAPRIIP